MVLSISTSCPARGVVLRLFAGTVLLPIVVYASAAAATPPTRRPSAHAAHTLRASDEARMHYIEHKSSSTRLYEEGTAHGTMPGRMRAYCSLGATFAASFTIYTNGGSISGHGTATPHGGGLYESFAGRLTVTGGTGRYAHAHGHAGLYGTFNRRTYAIVVQTTGSLSY